MAVIAAFVKTGAKFLTRMCALTGASLCVVPAAYALHGQTQTQIVGPVSGHIGYDGQLPMMAIKLISVNHKQQQNIAIICISSAT